MKKISAILLALVMLLSMTAMAASITINVPANSNTGSDTGITYTAYKIFDAEFTKVDDDSYDLYLMQWKILFSNYFANIDFVYAYRDFKKKNALL